MYLVMDEGDVVAYPTDDVEYIVGLDYDEYIATEIEAILDLKNLRGPKVSKPRNTLYIKDMSDPVNEHYILSRFLRTKRYGDTFPASYTEDRVKSGFYQMIVMALVLKQLKCTNEPEVIGLARASTQLKIIMKGHKCTTRR